MKLDSVREELSKLRDKFEEQTNINIDAFSEEIVRAGYINKFFEIVGWDLADLHQVLQEKTLTGIVKERLDSIKSVNRRPDYELTDRGTRIFYFDAKNVGVDFQNDKDIAFQIRSYGWSAQLPYSIVSNFQLWGIYDTSFRPSKKDSSKFKVIYFTIDELISNLELYLPFFEKRSSGIIPDLSTIGISQNQKRERSIDAEFLQYVRRFRIELSEAIHLEDKNVPIGRISIQTQMIINQLIFIRFLEDSGIEPKGELKELYQNGGFWAEFCKLKKSKLDHDYDGAMFSDHSFNLNLPDHVFKRFIDEVYGDSPYRFDVIDPLLIAQIYELFLGEELILDSGKVKLRKKRTNPKGSVSTPYQLAQAIIRPYLTNIDSLAEIDHLRILDPNAGSGTFLLAAFEMIAKRKEEILDRKLLFIELKQILTKSIFGVDIDPVAIEVLRMGISLKLMLADYIGHDEFKNALGGFKNNFCLGNSILAKEASNHIGIEEQISQIPTDYTDLFPLIMQNGGFTHIFSNPPYVESKYLNQYLPDSYRYLKKFYDLDSGKVDESLFFIKRYFQLLKENGNLAIVVQRRFFQTNYGTALRVWLAKKGYITKIVALTNNHIFKGHTTYVAVIHGEKNFHSQVNYEVNNMRPKRYAEVPLLLGKITGHKMIPTKVLEQGYWSLKGLATRELSAELIDRTDRQFYRFNDSNSEQKVIVGPQVLDKKYYFLRGKINEKNLFEGLNNMKEKVLIEKDVLRPIIENDRLHSFMQKPSTNLYIIFPYDSKAKELSSNELKNNFPLAWKYLNHVRMASKTAKNSGLYWYGYTRKQNLLSLYRPKVFVPMTSLSVVAFLQTSPMFGDNSNLNAIVDHNNDTDLLKALATIMNSKIFNLLAIGVSGDQQNGYHKFNKQYIGIVPVPELTNEEKQFFSQLYDKIVKVTASIENSFGDMQEKLFDILHSLDTEINNKVDEIYRISNDRRKELLKMIGPYKEWTTLITS
ncbi:Eco57I restriction-modification methylase domain-containing protein [Lacticaseibacillus paracasei]|uniref:Eco57I restriction-modification methylase domain-containing protein n=1 Tax=Lacticaseibacillus paracasei TaxID=1597 RepID=UPI0003A0BD25|nr:N-6 DNA methylase [Lacticaseibacillus paracasei]UNG79625.1 N-6 DNA methylase [Lacticaseibacillus paracasei]